MSELAEKVKKVLADTLNKDVDMFTESANFIDDLGADSLDTVEVVIALENEFDITIDDDDAESLITVGEVVSYVTEAVGE